MSLTIMLVLALAANTSFGGLPVLASLLARNNYLPHLFALRDDRQVFASGIWTLAILSGALLVAVGGNTLTLIPLFAIGVFTGFTLSQGGLVVHWRRTRPPRWRVPREPQRPRRGRHGRGHRRIPGDEVHRGRLGCGAGVARVHHAVHPDPPLLRPGRARPRHRPNPRQAPGQADHGRGARDRGVEARPVRDFGGAVYQRARGWPSQSCRSGAGEESERVRELQRQWTRWNPGVPLRVLRTEYASVARPIVAFVDRLRRRCRRAGHRADPGGAARQAALPVPAQPHRPGPHQGIAVPAGTSSSPACRCGCTSTAAPRR